MKNVELIKKYGRIPWENPKMTSLTNSTGWTVTYSATYPSRVVRGAIWYLFGDGTHGTCEIYVDNSSWSVKLITPNLRPYILTKLGIMIGRTAGYYRNGTGCYVRVYRNGVVTALGKLVYTSGLTLSQPVMFDMLEYYGFYGGYQADDLCHDVGAIPLYGFQL